MSEILPGHVWREIEFFSLDGPNDLVTGACGWCALAMAESWSKQEYISTKSTYQRAAAAKRMVNRSGAATLNQVAAQAVADGFQVTILHNYTGDIWAEWHAMLLPYAGVQALVIQVSNGQVLHDYLTSKGENAVNLKYHAIMLAGYHIGGYSDVVKRDLPSGFWACDGDNWDMGSALQFYPDANLDAAHPCSAFVVHPRVAIPVPHPVPAPPTTPDVPEGWRDDGHTLSAPNGHTVIEGFRAWVLAHSAPLGQPQDDSRAWPGVPGGSFQVFDTGILTYDSANGVVAANLGRWYEEALATLGQIQGELVTAQAAVIVKDATIATLQSQVSTAETAKAAALATALETALSTYKAAA